MEENKFVFDCNKCPHRCDGISKMVYIFKSDAEYSEEQEKKMIDNINVIKKFVAKKCEKDGYPDIDVFSKENNKTFYIEIKCQRRTFMSVKKILPQGNLEPSETLALNLSDLLRYFDIHKQTKEKIFILWCVENRPCIVEQGNVKYYYQDVEVLEKIYNYYKEKRRFRRKSGYGDVDQYGNHKGVVVNYHFSINELKELDLLEILENGKK